MCSNMKVRDTRLSPPYLVFLEQPTYMCHFTFNHHLHRDSTLLLLVILPTCTVFVTCKVLIIYPSSHKYLWTLLNSDGPPSRCLSVIALVRMIWNLTVAGDGVSSGMLLITGSSMYKILFQKLTVRRMLNNSQRFTKSEGLFTVFIKACQRSFSWVRGIQSTPSRPISWKFLFVLFSIIRQGFPSGMFPLVHVKFKIWPICVCGI